MQSQYEAAVAAIDSGDAESLRRLLNEDPDLESARGESNTPLLIQLIDWPSHRPRAAESARVLLEAGVEVRRDDENGTALGGAVCTEEVDVIEVLLDFGADIHAPCGWEPGTVLDLVDRLGEDLEKADDGNVVGISQLFSQAAGRPVPQKSRVGGTVPLLFVADVKKALKYYSDVLGFRTNFLIESESECEGTYASVQRGGAEFHVTGCQCEDRRHIGNLYVRVDADPVDQLFEELSAAGVTIRNEPTNEPCGL